MSVRKRIWKTAAGEERHAWLCDYTGQSGKRHVKTFARKRMPTHLSPRPKSKSAKAYTRRTSESVTIRRCRGPLADDGCGSRA